MKVFPSEIHDRLGWYVYRLLDPRTGHTFYVGKGQRNRVFEHANGLLDDDIDDSDAGVMSLKNETIRSIHTAGLTVMHLIHRHGIDDEDTAYQIEAALMDAYPGLTNVAGGHGNSLRGCRSVEEIVSAYAAPPLVVHEPLILIYIGKTLEQSRSVYDAVRGVWRMSKSEAEKRKLVLAYDGVLVNGAFRPKEWVPASKTNFPFLAKDVPNRIGFVGREAEVAADYIGRRVPPRKKGEAGPFRYLAP